MKVLVTGHKGYLGAVLTETLVEAGHQVTGIDVDFYHDGNFVSAPREVAEIRKDMRDLAVTDLKGFDAVCHLAALCNDPLGNLNPDWTYDINHRASVHIADCAKKAGVERFLFSSSCSMYGAAKGEDFLSEQSKLAPVTPYAVSKVRSEEDIHRMADRHFSPIFLRNATAYGVSPRLRADLVLNNLMGWAVTSGKVKILSDGTPWRPLVHAEDIARAFAYLLGAPKEKIHNQAFNIGTDEENYQVREIARVVEATVPGSATEYAGTGEPDLRNYRVSFKKLRQTFPEFRLRWNIRDGARQLFEAYRKTNFTLDDLKSRKYQRVLQLKHLLETKQLDSTLRWAAAHQRLSA